MGRMKELWQARQEMEEQQELGDIMEEAHVQRVLIEAAELIEQQPSRMTELLEMMWKAR